MAPMHREGASVALWSAVRVPSESPPPDYLLTVDRRRPDLFVSAAPLLLSPIEFRRKAVVRILKPGIRFCGPTVSRLTTCNDSGAMQCIVPLRRLERRGWIRSSVEWTVRQLDMQQLDMQRKGGWLGYIPAG